MGLQQVKSKLDMLGIQVIDMNSFGLLYLTKDKGNYGLVLQDSNGATKDVGYSFIDVEFGQYMIATGGQEFGRCKGLYIKDSFKNLLDGKDNVILTTTGNILTFRAKLARPFDKLVLALVAETGKYFEYELINYKGKRLKFKIPYGYLGKNFISSKVSMLSTSSDCITLYFNHKELRYINMISVDIELNSYEILGTDAIRDIRLVE